MRVITKRIACLTLIAVVITCVPARAQSGTTGTLNGVVRDSTGAVLPGVGISVRNPGTGVNRTTITDGEGRWTIVSLPVGTYEVAYELTGFKTLIRSGVAVEAAVPRTVDARLEVAGSNETVTVMSDALLVTPDTSTTFRKINTEELLQVPTSTRSFTHLLSAEAGITVRSEPL